MTVMERLEELKIVPVVVLEREEDALPLGRALIDGGLPCAEVTFRTPAGAGAISRLIQAYPEMLIGAGTILTEDQAEQAVKAGASFLVSPGLNPAVISWCQEHGIPVIPGCATPSEVEGALRVGLRTVKFFPAEQAGGLPMIRAMAAAYGEIRFMPTGGINPTNVQEYLACDKILACGGSWMVDPALIRAGDFDRIEKLVRAAVRLTGPKPHLPAAPPLFKTPKTSAKVVTMGEIMLRLSPPGYERLTRAGSMEAHYGGAEANVAMVLAGFGHQVSFVTRLPENHLGDAAAAALKSRGVDCRYIARGGNRLGLYFLEKGASVRPSGVIYDRAGSAFAESVPADFDFDTVFTGADLFHVSGITPVLSESCAEITKKAILTARAHGVTISFDMNYRGKLWQQDIQEKQAVIRELLPLVDICIGNPLDAAKMCGYESEGTDYRAASYSECISVQAMAEMLKEYGFARLAATCRESVSASDNGWSAVMSDGTRLYKSRHYNLRIIDRVGGGDAFTAGLLHGLLTGMDDQRTLEFAVAAAAIKHTIPGDVCDASLDEIEALLTSGGAGRVVR